MIIKTKHNLVHGLYFPPPKLTQFKPTRLSTEMVPYLTNIHCSDTIVVQSMNVIKA